MVLKKSLSLYFIFVLLLAFGLANNTFANIKDNNLSQTEKIYLSNGQQYLLEAYNKPGSLPKLIAHGQSNNQQTIQFGENKADVFSSNSLLHFKVYHIKGLPDPLIMAVAAAPAGSDTIFITKLLAFENRKLKSLNDTGWQTLIEGGVSISSLYKQPGNAIVWNLIWENSESHVDPHRYEATIYQWNGKNFVAIKNLKTVKKYNDGTDALKELNIQATDILTKDFTIFDQYR